MVSIVINLPQRRVRPTPPLRVGAFQPRRRRPLEPGDIRRASRRGLAALPPPELLSTTEPSSPSVEIAHTCELGPRPPGLLQRAPSVAVPVLPHLIQDHQVGMQSTPPAPRGRDNLVAGAPDPELLPPVRPLHVADGQAGVLRGLQGVPPRLQRDVPVLGGADHLLTPTGPSPPTPGSSPRPSCRSGATPQPPPSGTPNASPIGPTPVATPTPATATGPTPSKSRDQRTTSPPNERPDGLRVAIRGTGLPSTGDTGAGPTRATDISGTELRLARPPGGLGVPRGETDTGGGCPRNIFSQKKPMVIHGFSSRPRYLVNAASPPIATNRSTPPNPELQPLHNTPRMHSPHDPPPSQHWWSWSITGLYNRTWQ